MVVYVFFGDGGFVLVGVGFVWVGVWIEEKKHQKGNDAA